MFYHLIIEIENNKEEKTIYLKNKENLDEINIIAKKYYSKEDFFVDGFRLNYDMIKRFKAVSTKKSLSEIANAKMQKCSRGGFACVISSEDILSMEEHVVDITDKVLNDNVNKEHSNNTLNSKRIFIVHGRNKSIRDEVELFVRKLNMEPVILFQEPSKGNTIIEKIEEYSSTCCYGIVIYSPDDVGKYKEDDKLLPRARQNVILEHGYLMAKFGRERVCALVVDDTEKPGDIDGVVYINYDKKGAWQFFVAKEMKAIGINVSIDSLI